MEDYPTPARHKESPTPPRHKELMDNQEEEKKTKAKRKKKQKSGSEKWRRKKARLTEHAAPCNSWFKDQGKLVNPSDRKRIAKDPARFFSMIRYARSHQRPCVYTISAMCLQPMYAYSTLLPMCDWVYAYLTAFSACAGARRQSTLAVSVHRL